MSRTKGAVSQKYLDAIEILKDGESLPYKELKGERLIDVNMVCRLCGISPHTAYNALKVCGYEAVVGHGGGYIWNSNKLKVAENTVVF